MKAGFRAVPPYHWSSPPCAPAACGRPRRWVCRRTVVKGTFADINVITSAPGLLTILAVIRRAPGDHRQTAPGHSLIIITSGTVTDYESDDRHCQPHVYQAPATFVDSGGDHVHMIRNETSAIATGYAVQLIPAGATRRIDADVPENCQP